MNLQELEEVCAKMWSQIDKINERTKKHTLYIKQLQKEVKNNGRNK